MALRLRAIRALARVLGGGEKADAALERAREGLSAADGAWVHAAVMGALRRCFSLEADLDRFLRRRPEMTAWCALLVGAYQIRHMRVPPHAAVGETVAAVKRLRPRASGMVNAVLRRIAASPPPTLSGHRRRELPGWLDARLVAEFGEAETDRIAAVIRREPPLTLAVLEDRGAWLARAQAAGIAVREGGMTPQAVLLEGGAKVESLPGYAQGAFVVMDQAAQMAAWALIQALEGRQARRVLDVCAAPGGKTALLAAGLPESGLVAIERSARRMPRLRENLARLGLARLGLGRVRLVRGDALRLPLPDDSADAILLDAPCSASGVLRRHPDAKFLHQPADIEALAGQQRRMLDEAWRVLSPGSALVYAVCSILPEEGAQVVAGRAGLVQTQRLMPTEDHDGFFIAVFRK